MYNYIVLVSFIVSNKILIKCTERLRSLVEGCMENISIESIVGYGLGMLIPVLFLANRFLVLDLVLGFTDLHKNILLHKANNFMY